MSTGFQRHSTDTFVTKSMGTYTLTVETMMSFMSFSCVDFVNPFLLVYNEFEPKGRKHTTAEASMQSCSCENIHVKCMQKSGGREYILELPVQLSVGEWKSTQQFVEDY